ncbi:MAG: serine/threonine protein kinase [Vallitaleaceae bacterium]|nr:serine/threonine protein kinase [Vallitaleaceae bacterium]
MELGNVYFEKYKILDVLGRGGSSEVYLAENIKMQTKWAIKKTSKSEDKINLLAEPNILKNLDHIYIPKIIDIEEDEQSFYIIEEFVEGINLKTYKMRHPVIEMNLILTWAIKLCDVLKYLHSKKPHPIIYRDMKPENIMLMEDGKIKVIDFGIAREFKEDCLNDTIPIGTKGYAAPEQYGIGQSDERTDIFSLGMTLYYLLTSKNLTNPPYQIQWTEQLNTDESHQLLQIVLKCCEILPSNRYQNIEALESDLANLLHSEISEPVIQKKSMEISSNGGNSLNLNKTVTIGMLGVANGVGVTHAAIMLAQVLSKNNKVALIEFNDSKHFEAIMKVTQGESTLEKKQFVYNKVHYYMDTTYSQFLTNHREQFRFVILDLGSYDQLRDVDEFVRADVRIVVGHGMDWKIGEIERFYGVTRGYDPNNRWNYLIPFLDQKGIKDVKEVVGGKVFPLPYQMNPFSTTQEVKKIFEKLLGSS